MSKSKKKTVLRKKFKTLEEKLEDPGVAVEAAEGVAVQKSLIINGSEAIRKTIKILKWQNVKQIKNCFQKILPMMISII